MEQQQPDLTKQLRALWRFKWMIMLAALVAGAVAWPIAARQPPVYEATATLMVQDGQPGLIALPTALQTGLEIAYSRDIGGQVEVMKSRGVLKRALTQLEPDRAVVAEYLQLEVEKLQTALEVRQVGGTNLVALTVVASDPAVAQQQANAVAEAYIYEVRTAMQTAIESALENTTRRLEELGKGEVDLSNNPSLTRLTAQIDAATVALEATSEHLQRMAPSGAGAPGTELVPGAKDAGTVLTRPQLSLVDQRVAAATAEADELHALAEQLGLQVWPTISGDDIAAFESRTRALATKIEDLSTELAAIQGVEIDPPVRGELLAVEDQLRVAGATTSAILEQVVALYAVQERLRAAGGTVEVPDVDSGTEEVPDAAGGTVEVPDSEAHANLLDRMVQYTDLLAATLKAASEQVAQIEPRVATLTQWWLEMLGERTASATAALRAISEQLQPRAPEAGILLTRDELAVMEMRARTIAITVTSLLAELEKVALDEIDPQVYAQLLSVRERVNVASDATGGLRDEIASLAESGGDIASYAALNDLRQELQLALLSIDGNATRVVDTAVVSPKADLFSRYRSVILAVVAGLLLGILGALVLQYFDRTVRDAPQVTSYVGLPLLGRVGRATAGRNPHRPSVLTESPSRYLEDYRLLRTNLGLDSCRGQVLLVSSPGEREGKTTVAANLARVVALQGRKVLLIDGNLRQPAIATAFGLAEGEGLSESLTGENEPLSYTTTAEGIDVLPAGAASATSAEMLASPRMRALLEKAKETYDVVIVDSAPVIGFADTRILARDVDGVLLVLQPDASNLELARESKQALETMGARVTGFVLNKGRA